MTEKAKKRLTDEMEWLQQAYEAIKDHPSPSIQLNTPVVEALIESNKKILTSFEQKKPFIASYYCYAPELYAAMDLPWYGVASPVTTTSTAMQEYTEECDKLDIPTDVCTAIRMTLYYIEAALCLPAAASICMITPCDGMQILNQVLAANENWKDVPMFAPDPPYMDDERAIDYYAQEYRNMVAFIEEHTGHRLDMDRLREIVEESNTQYQLWSDFNELRRAVPTPHGYKMGNQVWTMVQMLWAGDPRCTKWLKDLIAETEKRVRANKGAVKKEKIRLFWYDIRPIWIDDFASWLEKEWGAVIVMDMFTYNPYTLIDTSTEESMFRGLAKRGLCDVPMVRQERGTPDHFASDISGIVKDYKIDCVVWPAHMGHKAMSGTVGIGREICRDLGVPLLNIGLDLFDSRYTTADEVKDKMSQFFTAMGMG